MIGVVARVIGLALVATSFVPIAARAECVTVPSEKRPVGPVAKPTLVFSGTVTAVDPSRYTVSFNVDRIWVGQLRRETVLFVAPAVEGANSTSFRPGQSYLVTSTNSVNVFNAADQASTGLTPGTVGVSFGCGDGPVPLSQAGEALKRLGRGRAPLP